VKPEPILSDFEAVVAGGQGPQWAVGPIEEEEDDDDDDDHLAVRII
jgi:hypothetical protein